MSKRFYRADGSPDHEFDKAWAEREQRIAEERLANRRRRAVEYLHSHPEQMQANRARARAAADRKRRSDPVMARKLEIYDHLVEIQGGEHCAICKKPRPAETRRFAIDHDHETDEIRGLLCRRCNAALGRTREQGKDWLRAALEYLDRTSYTGLKHAEVRYANHREYALLNGGGGES